MLKLTPLPLPLPKPHLQTCLRAGFSAAVVSASLFALGSVPVQAQALLGSSASEELRAVPAAPADAGLPAPEAAGGLNGTVKDLEDVAIGGAEVTLLSERAPHALHVQTTEDGSFAFHEVVPGPYELSVTLPGFQPRSVRGVLEERQTVSLGEVALSLVAVETEVNVTAGRREIATAQIEFEEKQRVLGVFPNFYASYLWNAEPLSARQKFSLAWRFSTDPTAFAMAGVVAGAEQWQHSVAGYGWGAQGFGKRLGATYADGLSSTMLGQAVFPALFHQDPRYFVKGTGTVASRALYAIATTVICRGDNHRWQMNYSNILGNFASASLSNVYYPTSSRDGVGLTLQNSIVTTAFGAIGGLIQEFLLHRMTPNLPNYGPETVR